MKKLLLILGILLLSGLAVACKKQQEEPLAPEVEGQPTETAAAVDEVTEEITMEPDESLLDEEQETDEEGIWDAGEEPEESYLVPEWDLTEPETPEEAPAEPQDLREEQDYEEMAPEEGGADMEEPSPDEEQTL